MGEKQENLSSMSDTHNTQFDLVEGRVFFVERPYWRMHRIVGAKLDKLEKALDVNHNDKSEFSERMNRYFIKLLFLSAVIYFKSFNTKHTLTQFHLAPVQKNFITAFFY